MNQQARDYAFDRKTEICRAQFVNDWRSIRGWTLAEIEARETTDCRLSQGSLGRHLSRIDNALDAVRVDEPATVSPSRRSGAKEIFADAELGLTRRLTHRSLMPNMTVSE